MQIVLQISCQNWKKGHYEGDNIHLDNIPLYMHTYERQDRISKRKMQSVKEEENSELKQIK